jgi:hypothetical protein
MRFDDVPENGLRLEQHENLRQRIHFGRLINELGFLIIETPDLFQ